MNLNICLYPYESFSSGIRTYTLELAEALSKVGVQVYLLCFDIDTLSKTDSIQYIDLGSSPPRIANVYSLVMYNTIRKKIYSVMEKQLLNDIDIIHSVQPPTALSFNEFCTITTVWFPPISLQKRIMHGFKVMPFYLNIPMSLIHLQYHILDLQGIKRSQKVLCVTKNLFNEIYQKYPEKAVYLPPGINCNARTKNNKNEKPVILFATRDLEISRKNIATFLNAIQILGKKSANEFIVMLIGKHSQKFDRMIKRISNKTGINIQLTQRLPREEFMKTYNIADIFVCTSLYEEFGYVVLEAMSYGLPIVCSDIYSFQDIVKNRVNGFLLPAKDPVAFAGALEKLIKNEDLRMKMGRESYKIVKEKFDWNVLIKKYISEYEKVLKNR